MSFYIPEDLAIHKCKENGISYVYLDTKNGELLSQVIDSHVYFESGKFVKLNHITDKYFECSEHWFFGFYRKKKYYCSVYMVVPIEISPKDLFGDKIEELVKLLTPKCACHEKKENNKAKKNQ